NNIIHIISNNYSHITPLLKSCYFPYLLRFNHLLPKLFLLNGHFKVFLSDIIFRNKSHSFLMFNHWVTNKNSTIYNISTLKYYNISKNYFYTQYTPLHYYFIPQNITNIYKFFFKGCNDRLYEFL